MPEVYTNQFDGYTTTFYVWRGSHRECVIRWDNVSPVEVVIPYETELTPDILTTSIDELLERAEDITYDDYPFRSRFHQVSASCTMYEIYWGPKHKYMGDDEDYDVLPRPTVRIYSSGHSDSTVHRAVAIETITHSVAELENNLIALRNTLQY